MARRLLLRPTLRARSVTRLAAALLGISALGALAPSSALAAGTGAPRTQADAALTAPATTTVAAQLGASIGVYESPAAAKPFTLLDKRTNFSGRHVFVVLGQEGTWLKVLLPMRPNGRTGYVRMGDVSLYQHDYYIRVTLTKRQLVLFKAGKAVMTESVGVGTARYPTPVGQFFARELARPSNPRGAYGPWAFGLSGYSNVLQKFGRGDGQIGIHGTNQPKLLGQAVSHGCIRMRNEAITKLAQILPQGVPVEIVA